MADVKFWRCNHCGNLFYTIVDGGVTPQCCGEPMELLVADSVDAATEKHVPSIAWDGNHIEVNVGSVDHPMTPEHLIEWVALVADNGDVTIKRLAPEDAPHVRFCGKNLEHGTVYAYCNLHGLWKTEVSK